MSAHPSIQDLSSEAKFISHDTNPLAIVGYRLQVALLAPAGRIGFSARWYSLCTELHRCQDTIDESVESVLAIPIRMRASSWGLLDAFLVSGIWTHIAFVKGKWINHFSITKKLLYAPNMEPIVRFERTRAYTARLQVACNQPLCDIGKFNKKRVQRVVSTARSHYGVTQPLLRSWPSECSIVMTRYCLHLAV